MSAEGRDRLGQEQEALIEALVAGGQVPPGFDPVKLAAAAAALVEKRDRAAKFLGHSG